MTTHCPASRPAAHDLARTPLPMTGHVGIFWVYQTCLMAQPVPLERAQARGAKRDSPDAHVQVWPRMVARHRAERPILSILEYDEVPRGRVVFDTTTQTFVIDMDVTLFANAEPAQGPSVPVWDGLRVAFQLEGQRVRFATDPHYRVDPWGDEEDVESDPS